MQEYQVAIIGGGPGGYVSGLRLGQYGISTVVFEKGRLGGVCLNWGCIPTKSLVRVAELYFEMKSAERFGIKTTQTEIDFPKVIQRKEQIVEKLVSGVEYIYKKRKLPLVRAEVKKIRKEKDHYVVSTTDQSFLIKYVIIASGSVPKELPGIKFDRESILSSEDVLKLEELPDKMVIIGGGVIGCEYASIFNQFGVEIEIVEFLPNLINNEDQEISRRLASALKKRGIKIHTRNTVVNMKKNNNNIELELSNGNKIKTKKVLLSVGRKPALGIKFERCELGTENNFIQIDEKMRTNLDNIFAIGDVTGKLMLAHTASKQGLIVADIIDNEMNGNNRKIVKLDYHNIPRCTFTNPEIGTVGLTETLAKAECGEIRVGKFMFTASGKALALGDTYGFVKTVSDKKGRILGIHIIGPQATELIASGGILLGLKATTEDIRKVVFAHPTLAEAVMESIEDVENLAIHKL